MTEMGPFKLPRGCTAIKCQHQRLNPALWPHCPHAWPLHLALVRRFHSDHSNNTGYPFVLTAKREPPDSVASGKTSSNCYVAQLGTIKRAQAAPRGAGLVPVPAAFMGMCRLVNGFTTGHYFTENTHGYSSCPNS